MRFITKYSGYKIPAVHEQTERLADGTTKVIAPGYMVEFKKGDLTNYEREYARKVFIWKGLPTEPGSNRELDPIDDLHRVASFDTADIRDPQLRQRVEKALLDNGAHGQDYVVVEQARPVAPWPSYDRLTAQGRRTVQMVAEKIADTVRDNGYDPDTVAAYERQNLNRTEVLEALAGLSGSTDEEPEVVAA